MRLMLYIVFLPYIFNACALYFYLLYILTVQHYGEFGLRSLQGYLMGPVGWLVGCFRFSCPLRQYFSLYRAVSQREGERGEKGQRRVKMSKQPPPAPTASAIGPCPTIIQIVGRPGTGSSPRTIAPPDTPMGPVNVTTGH